MSHPVTIVRPCIDRHPTLRPAECSHCRGFTPSAPPAPRAASRGRSRPPAAAPCAHLGPPTGERRVVLNCINDPPNTAPLRTCAIHGVCTEDVGVRGKPPCCRFCSDDTRRRPPARPPIRTRHLLYHLLPVTGTWQRAAAGMLARWDVFNGRKVVAVCTGPPSRRAHGGNQSRGFALDPPDQVRAALPADAEVLEIPNDPNLREVRTFDPLFSAVAGDTDPTTATLYAHAKGVTQPPGDPVHHWADVMHEVYLDFWPVVDDVLRAHPVAGAFRKLGRGWNESASDWHYSGSWFWFRNAELFARPDWRRIDRFWSGIEPYPSLHFEPAEAGVIFHDGRVGVTNLYDAGQWARAIDPALAAWRAANAHRRATP